MNDFWIGIGVVMLVFSFGILIRYFKAYFLIAGYNLMSDEKKKNVDIEGFSKLVGNHLCLIGIMWFIFIILNKYGIIYAVYVDPAAMGLAIITLASSIFISAEIKNYTVKPKPASPISSEGNTAVSEENEQNKTTTSMTGSRNK